MSGSLSSHLKMLQQYLEMFEEVGLIFKEYSVQQLKSPRAEICLSVRNCTLYCRSGLNKRMLL